MKRLKYVVLAMLMLVGVAGVLVPSVVHADSSKSVVCESIGAGPDCGTTPGGGSSLNNLVALIINIMSWLVGVVAVIMVIVAGFRYITAGGDSSKLTGAKNTLIYAIVGLVVVAMAQFIVQFVISKTAHL